MDHTDGFSSLEALEALSIYTVLVYSVNLLFIAVGFSRTSRGRTQRGSCWPQQTSKALISSGKVRQLKVGKSQRPEGETHSPPCTHLWNHLVTGVN